MSVPERSEAAAHLGAAADILGSAEAVELWSALVSHAPTNLEDPAHGRWEKPNYPATAQFLEERARAWGFGVRRFDPAAGGAGAREFHGIPRPNVIVDLEVGARERVLLLAHYDVVPVPAEQLPRWKTPPHVLSPRADGRLYGRGSNDDLGSGVVASLIALRRLKENGTARRNVRLLICCDEETGGAGGIEAIKARDGGLPAGDPGRFLQADVALIPDGSPHVSAGSSGVLFVDAGFDRRVPYDAAVAYGMALVRLHELARTLRSRYDSPDYPDHRAPDPKVTGRATLTRFDLVASAEGILRPRLTRVHAETDATNQIAQSVTLVFEGPGEKLLELNSWLPRQVSRPFRLRRTEVSAVPVPTGALAVSLIGKSYHAGYPHQAENPVPAALRLIDEAVANAKIEDDPLVEATFGLDLRLPPEMPLEAGRGRFLGAIQEWIAHHPVGATISAPPDRQRGGYALDPDHPAVLKLDGILRRTLGSRGIFGEYGGTDASSLLGIFTPSGDPLPALVVGSMDRAAHIHEAEESADPRLVRAVADTLVEFIEGP